MGDGGTGAGTGAPSWWSHPDGSTGRGAGFRLPPDRLPAAAPGPTSRPQPSEPPAPAASGRGGTGLRIAVLAVFAVLCAGLLGGGVGAVVQGTRQGGRITLRPATEAGVSRPADTTAGVVKAALPGVVYLSVRTAGQSVTGTGTGIVLDGAGHILTNNHVVAPAGRPGQVTVTFSTGQRHPAALVGRDVDSDLAVIQVKGVRGLRPLALGSAAGLQVGDPVVAIGAPFGLVGTVTSGILSAKDRPLTSGSASSGTGLAHLDALQTDAPINPGNSGGPLLDSAGTVVGVNTVIRSATADSADPYAADDEAGSIGLGFAIPIDRAIRVAEQLVNTGRADRTTIGATLLPDHTGSAEVGSVSRTGTAARAGLRAGDLVTAVDGNPVTSAADLVALIRGGSPGQRAVLTLWRDGDVRSLSVLLRSAPGSAPADSA
ncbi:S1C family serine protease [Streptacidiphilus sp. N8-3]|uniref:S1C family serine protease n=2 Tax=Streptacidiphilus cavernicola TaxID=3342716 RepID=A0ABV6VUS4_9ACTN